MLHDLQAIVLAAGKSTRFNTGNTKLIEKICGQELLLYPLSVLEELQVPTAVVLGFQKNKIQPIIEKHYDKKITLLEQQEVNGTAGALRFLDSHFKSPYILVMKADVPLISSDIIESLYQQHIATNAAVSLVTAHNGDPSGYTYNRVIKDGAKIHVKTARELSLKEIQDYCCVNGGIYLFSKTFLQAELSNLTKKETDNEYHASDLVNIATEKGYTVSTTTVSFDQIRGINTHQELWAIEQIKRSELIKYWMDRGVRFSSAQTVHMDLNVEIGTGTFIGSSVHLLSGTKIGQQCTVGPFTILENATLGDKVTIESHSILRNATIGSHTQVGPFANIQEQTIIGDNCVIGNFVETKRVSIGNNSKAKHLSYLADAHIGSQVNIGAGTITCNYDGSRKHTTTIEDNVFIGTNNSLVAPVTIEKDAFTAAGSTITHNVPTKALAIGRSRQVVKENYMQKDDASKKNEDTNTTNTKEEVSFIGAYKTNNEAPTTDQ